MLCFKRLVHLNQFLHIQITIIVPFISNKEYDLKFAQLYQLCTPCGLYWEPKCAHRLNRTGGRDSTNLQRTKRKLKKADPLGMWVSLNVSQRPECPLWWTYNRSTIVVVSCRHLDSAKLYPRPQRNTTSSSFLSVLRQFGVKSLPQIPHCEDSHTLNFGKEMVPDCGKRGYRWHVTSVHISCDRNEEHRVAEREPEILTRIPIWKYFMR